MIENHLDYVTSLHTGAPLGASRAVVLLHSEPTALQTLIDILTPRADEIGCGPCGGSGVRGRGLCDCCRGRGTLLSNGQALPGTGRF